MLRSRVCSSAPPGPCTFFLPRSWASSKLLAPGPHSAVGWSPGPLIMNGPSRGRAGVSEHWSSGMIPASGAGGRGFNSPMLPFCKAPAFFARCKEEFPAPRGKKHSTHDGTRTHNLALRRGTPYPFGHAGGTLGWAHGVHPVGFVPARPAPRPAPWPSG